MTIKEMLIRFGTDDQSAFDLIIDYCIGKLFEDQEALELMSIEAKKHRPELADVLPLITKSQIYQAMADVMHITPRAVYRKLTGDNEFTVSEVERLSEAERLNIAYTLKQLRKIRNKERKLK